MSDINSSKMYVNSSHGEVCLRMGGVTAIAMAEALRQMGDAVADGRIPNPNGAKADAVQRVFQKAALNIMREARNKVDGERAEQVDRWLRSHHREAT